MSRRKKSTLPKRRTSRPAPATKKIPMWMWLAGGGALALLLIAGLFYLGTNGQAIANSSIEGLVILPEQGRGHEDGDLHTDDEVPAGGTHNSQWQACGIYDQPVRQENVVHSMEHGAVWLAYQPDLPAGQVETLRQLVRSERSRMNEPLIVLAPKPGLSVPIVATAWRVQLELDNAADERLPAFLAKYQRGPFTPERGANCVTGLGEPIS